VVINEGELRASAMKVVEKVWGVEIWVTNTELYCLKFLKVKPGYQCSIHAHKKKDETFVGVSGMLQLFLHDKDGKPILGMALSPGKKLRISPKDFHSFQAVQETWVMEVSTHADDKDVIRLQESRRITT
jgi:D-lyxose ketol-isomerase